MAGSKTDWYENIVLQHLFKTDYTAPDPLYVALFLDSAKPTDAGGGTEASGGSYARESVARNTGWTLTGNAIENAADITFTEATASWGLLGAFALFDALTVGNMLYWGDLTTAKTINSGDTAKIPAGDLDITED
jgi:hypothetical protein